MLYNATILRIDTPVTTAGGSVSYINGPALNCRCFIGELRDVQRYGLSELEEKTAALLQVLSRDLIGALSRAGITSLPGNEQRLTVQPDGGMPLVVYRVRQALKKPGGDLRGFDLVVVED